MKLPTNSKLAAVYRTSDRQVARWKREKAPLIDVAAMMLWFSSRADMPDHLRSLSDDEQAEMQRQINLLIGEHAPVNAPTGKVLGRKIDEPLQGAQHALRRLEEEETRLYKQLADAEGSPVLEAAIRKQWRETLLSLKQYDVLVEAGRRDTGETITRAQIAPVLTALVVWLCRANEDFLNSICLQLADLEKPEDVLALVAATIRQSVRNAVRAATEAQKMPGWVQGALADGL